MNSEYSIPIVQGTAVPASESQQYNKSSYGPTTATLPNNRDGVFNDEEATTINFNHYGQPQQQQQQQQPNQFKDVIWAVAFVLHLGAMLFVISMNIANGDGGGGGGAAAGSYTGIYILVAIAVVVSGGLSSASIALMMKYPTEMVKAGLVSSGFLVGAMAITSLMSGSIFVTVISFLFFAATLYYIKVIWRRIPFAASEYYYCVRYIVDIKVLVVVGQGWGEKFDLIHIFVFCPFCRPTKCQPLILIIFLCFHNNSQPQDGIECRQIQHGTWCHRLFDYDSSIRLDCTLVGWRGGLVCHCKCGNRISSSGFILLDLPSLVQYGSRYHRRNGRNMVVCSRRSKWMLVNCAS